MKKLVLIVDDEATIRRFVRKLCKSLEGVECVEASNVRQALELLSAGNIDLVISDMSMPGETGLQILEHVKASDCRIPFVIFSGSVTSEERNKLIETGADIVLSKTVEPSKLKSVVKDMLELGKSVPAVE
jgi:CheY-like chemotaxis protein